MLDALTMIYDIIMDKLQDSRPKDIVWGLFAFSAVVLSWLMFVINKSLQRRHERRLRSRRVDNRRVRGVFFDFTESTLRAQPLHKASMDDWDESLRKLVMEWNTAKRPSAIIVPEDEHDTDALEDLIHTEASEMLVNSINGIRGFLQDDQIISEEDGFKHVRFLAALARPPKHSISWFDAARLVIIPIKSAKKMATMSSDSMVLTRLKPSDKRTWCAVLRQMGLKYLKRQRQSRHGGAETGSADESSGLRGMAIVDIAFDH